MRVRRLSCIVLSSVGDTVTMVNAATSLLFDASHERHLKMSAIRRLGLELNGLAQAAFQDGRSTANLVLGFQNRTPASTVGWSSSNSHASGTKSILSGQGGRPLAV